LNQENEIIAELIAYRIAGGGGQVDCQPGGAGRDANQLRKLSEISDVNIIASTGFHLKRYYPEDSKIWKMDLTEAVDYFRSEIRDGLEETRNGQVVYPGLIKVAVEATLELSPKTLLEAAVMVSKETGLAIEMHTEKGADLENVLKFFEDLNLDPARLVICHIDKRPDIGLHSELASSGYLLEYDTFFREKYQPELNLWPLIRGMVNADHASSLVLATDQADPAMWASMGSGPGLPGFLTSVKKRLAEEIGDPEIVNNLIGGNIAHSLAIEEGD
jgi:phosphotriesterase-related protein